MALDEGKTADELRDEVAWLRGRVAELESALGRRAQEHLLLRTLIDNLPDAIYAKDRDARKTLANRADLELIGAQNEAEVLGKTDFEVFPPEIAAQFWADDQAVLQTGQPVINREELVVSSKGQRRWLLTSKLPVRDQTGQITGMIGIGRNINEHKKAELVLQESEEKYRALVENSPDFIAIYQEGTLKYVNKAMCERLAWTFEEMTSASFNPIQNIIPQRLQSQIRENIANRLRGEVIPPYEISLKARDGSEIPVIVKAQAILYGGKLADEVIHIDVSELKKAEQKLRSSEEKFSKAFNLSPSAVFITSVKDGRFIEINKTGSEMFGYQPDEIVGRTVEELGLWVDPNDRATLLGRLQKEGVVRNMEASFRRKSGEVFDAIISVDTVDIAGQQFLLSTCTDITERKKAEEALKAREQQFRALIENSMDSIALLDDQGTILFFPNPATARMLGYDDRELVGRSVFELIHPDDRPRLSGLLGRHLRTHRAQVTFQLRFQHKDGTWRWLEATGTNLLAEPSVRALVMNYSDITERKKAEEELKAERQRLHDVLEAMPIGVCLLTPDYYVAFANRPFRDQFGESHGRRCYEYCFGKNEPCDFCETYTVLKTRKPHHWQVTTPDRARVIDVYDFPFTDVDGSPMILEMAIDITERRKAEEDRRRFEARLQHAQKLESLGVLAGGIAHDFNNLLTVVLGNLELARGELSPAAPAHDSLLEAQKASLRAADLCKQMLAYAGKGRFLVQKLDLNEVVREMAHLLDVSVSKKTLLKYSLTAPLPAIEGDPTQIRQVIMNLITNASEALGDENGVVSINTGVMQCDRAYLETSHPASVAALSEPLAEGLYVYLEVTDTGGGMDPATVARIFEPFFTTKFVGRGLGLSAVLGILRGHKGTIRIYSEAGKGSTFKVLFPASQQSSLPPSAAAELTAGPKAWRGLGTILVADDEPAVRSLAKRALEAVGFAVLTAADGDGALEVFRAHADEIACVLLDLTMPRLSGEQVFRELRRIRADVKVILCSGYDEQEVTQRFVGRGLAGFLQKPYQPSALQQKLQEVLGG